MLGISRKLLILLQLGIARRLQTTADCDILIATSIPNSGSRRKYKEEAFKVRMWPSECARLTKAKAKVMVVV